MKNPKLLSTCNRVPAKHAKVINQNVIKKHIFTIKGYIWNMSIEKTVKKKRKPHLIPECIFVKTISE